MIPLSMNDLADIAWQHRWSNQKDGKRTFENFNRAVSFHRDKEGPIIGRSTHASSVGNAEISKLSAALQESGLSNASVNRLMSALSGAFTTAEDIGAIPTSPRFKHLREKQGRTYQMPKAVFHKILEGSDKKDRQFFRMLWYTGMRRSEALGLKWDDVRSDFRTIILRDTKNGSDREIPLSPEAAGILEVLYIVRGPSTWPEDTRHLHGPFTNLSKSSVAEGWADAREHAGEGGNPECVPHALRHAYATRMAGAGVPLHHVQALLGHADIGTTMRYTHTNIDQLRASLEKVEEVQK